MLTESRRKWLTEYIGERFQPGLVGLPYTFEGEKVSNRTFTTWADLGAVMEAIQKKGEWENFVMFASRVHGSQYDGGVMGAFSDLIAWLINPSRLPELVCRWKGAE